MNTTTGNPAAVGRSLQGLSSGRDWSENKMVVDFANGRMKPKLRVIHRLKSATAGLSGCVRKNTYMENLVELPDGRRVYMTEKELDELNKNKCR